MVRKGIVEQNNQPKDTLKQFKNRCNCAISYSLLLNKAMAGRVHRLPTRCKNYWHRLSAFPVTRTVASAVDTRAPIDVNFFEVPEFVCQLPLSDGRWDAGTFTSSHL
jgi:hypothetical protein